jgi:hypothetical protein
VFVDVVGKIDDGDFQAFKEKTDQIGGGDPKKLVIVTLVSYGGSVFPAMQIGEWVRKKDTLGVSSFWEFRISDPLQPGSTGTPPWGRPRRGSLALIELGGLRGRRSNAAWG